MTPVGAEPRMRAGRRSGVSVRRHAGVIRATHWANALCILVLLMSGLQIFNAHPALYWGEASDFDHPLLSIAARRDVGGAAHGVTTVAGAAFDTTGLLGLFRLPDGGANVRAFPAWATLPGWHSLADGRRWHFFFAWCFVLNGLAYALHGLLSGHIRRDLIPSRHELAGIGRTLVDHARLRFPRGEEARRYNPVQQIAYVLVVGAVLPLVVLTGLCMSPRMDAAFPFLPALFGGRQSARTVHFAMACLVVGFVILHVAMVVLSGPWNNLRSMVTGRYVLPPPRDA